MKTMRGFGTFVAEGKGKLNKAATMTMAQHSSSKEIFERDL